MYERLTQRTENGGVKFSNGEYWNTVYPQNENCLTDIHRMAIKLCELEDKIEQGKIVELPCEIGQTVYKVTYPYRAEPKVTEFIVCGFNYCRNAKHKMIMNLHLALKANRKLKHTAKLKDIYFTPEEANKMLKELEGK